MSSIGRRTEDEDEGRKTEDGGRKTEDEGRREVDWYPAVFLFRYSAVLIFFALGLMAKPMLVTLPFVLLLLDYWPLQRFEPKKSAQEIRTEAPKRGAGSGKREAGSGELEPLSANKRKGKSAKMRTGQGIAQSSVLVTPEVLNPGPQSSALRPLLREKIPLFALAALSCIVTYVAQQKGGAVLSFEAIATGCSYRECLRFLYHLHWKDHLAN